MAESYPFTLSNNKLAPLFDKIRTAAKPSKFTHEFLKKLGFSSSNDRAIIPLFRRLGFLSDDGSPTEFYDRLRDGNDAPYVLAERMRALYEELYSINTEIHKAPDADIKNAIARITGKDATTVSRYFNTFKALANLAKFDDLPQAKVSEKKKTSEAPQSEQQPKPSSSPPPTGSTIGKKPEFYYNIQIHLPATTDISVYNAIFKSLKEHLLD